MAILNHGSTIRTADGGQTTTTIVTATNIGTYGVAANSTYFIGTTQNVFNRASGAQTLTGVSIDGNAANITAYTINQNVGTANTPSFAGLVSSAVTNYAFLQVTDTNNFWITPGNNNWGLYFETSAGGLLGGTGDSNRLGFVGAGAARFYVDLNNGNGWFGGSLTANTDSRAPIFYDSNNTAYYTDPASTSVLNRIDLPSGSAAINTTTPGQTVYQLNFTGQSTNDTAQAITWGWSTSGAQAGIYVQSSGGYGTKMYIATTDSFATGSKTALTIDHTGVVTTNRNYLQATGSLRAPIFYDSDNTAYYVDPASTSSLNVLTMAGTITGALDATVSFTGGVCTAASYNYILNGANDAGNKLVIFVNGSTRTADGGVNALTIRNDGGAFVLGSASYLTSILGSSVTINGNAALTSASTLTAGNLSGTIPSGVLGNSTVNIGTTAIALNRGSGSQTLTGVSIDGNSGTATILQTARNINGTSFNGSAAITTATWGTARTLTIGSTGKSVDGSAAVSWSLAEIGALPLSGGQITGNTTFSADNHLTFGPNSTWGSSIRIGGNGYTATGTETASVVTTDGNLHLDAAKSTNGIYLNWYGGTSGVFFGNGSSGQVAFVSNTGNASFSGVVDATQFRDASNTAFYVDPASTSVINALSLTVLNNINAANGVWHNSAEGKGRFYFGSNSHTYFKTAADFIFRNNSDIGVVTIDSVGNLRTSTSGDNFASYSLHVGGTGFATADFRSPIFYDSNNTAFYIDAASTSVLNKLTIDGGNYANNYFQSLSDFVNGTLVTTDIPATAANGLSFVMNVIGKSYNTTTSPFNFSVQGYLYNSTIINYSGLSLDSTGLTTIKIFENGGFLCFWWARVSYWNAFEVSVRSYDTAKTNYNRVTNVTDVVEPTGTKKVTVTLQTFMRADVSATNAVDLRSQIFYDTNNTAFYCDPTGTSNFTGLTVTNTITGNISGNAGTATTLQTARNINGTSFNGSAAITTATWGTARTLTIGSTGKSVDGSAAVSWSLAEIGAAAIAQTMFIGTTSVAINRASASQTLTGISIDGSSASCTGNSATTTLATKATRANGNFYIDDNYGNTVVGLYSANRYQGVFAMGDSYKLAADGLGVGTLYGIAWSHPNAGGVAANLNDHGALILLNGTYAAAISSSIRCATDMRTPIYYDSNNTVYYCDPASTSNLNAITAAGNVTAAQYYTGGWFRNNSSGNGLYNESTGEHFYSDAGDMWNVASANGTQGIRLRTGGHNGTVRGYFYGNDSNDVGFLNNAGSWRVRVVGGDYVLFDGSSIRAQIFYDSNDTNYYVNPASASVLNSLTVTDANLELYKSQTVDMSNTTTYSTSNYYPVTISVPTEGCIIQIQNNLNSNVPSWATHGGGFTLNLRWRTNGSGWGTTDVRRYIEQYHERFANQTICGGITQMTNSSIEVVWLRGGGQYYFKFSRNLSATAQAVAYTINSQTVTPGSTAQNQIWNAYSGYSILYNNQTVSTDNMYTPVLYDWNNSAYYVDPASTSNLVGLTVANTITGSITGNAGGSSASCTGNAATATTLQTARNINGTSFNGSANITTASWGTARTITIGSTGKSVDGSANASWSLAEITGSQTANTFLAAPNGSAGNPTFRAIVAADIPTLNQNTTGSSASCTGNSATATNLSTNRTNWSTNGTISAVVGQLAWKNYGNNHTIIDASNSTAPDGTAISNTNPGTAWSGTYPTLMGWNGASTYGVRVDSSRYADQVGYSPNRTDATTYPILWGAGSTYTVAYSCASVYIQSSTGTIYANGFYDAGNTAYYIDPASTSNLVGLTVANTITGSISGNAGTATTLQTARNINGTSFNGSAAITTATWGTARTITIGSTGKSVDGSAAVSWSLAEIGAAATNQTMFIGTTSVAINRASASLSLTGINIDGNAGTVTDGVYLSGSQTISGSKTFSADIQVNNVRVGRGPGNFSSNTVFGGVALSSNTTGINNSAFGYYSLKSNTSGDQNCAFGRLSLFSNTTGRANNAFGYRALRNLTTGISNSAFGTDALRYAVTSWYNCAFGEQALFKNLAGSNNCAYGSNSLRENTASNNSAFGDMTLRYNTIGSANSAFGRFSLRKNTTGSNNNAFGHYALNNNTSGVRNGSFGINALNYNTIGSDNHAFGARALYSNTTGNKNNAFGYQALYSNTFGGYNCGFGSYTLYSVSTGSNNTGIGRNAGFNLTTGSNVTCIGASSNPSSGTVSNEITLGNGSITSLRCQVTTITALSDQRDKADIESIDIGLDFIEKLKPVTFKWDKREWYSNGIKDGSKKENILQAGFIAQDLKKLQEENGVEYLKLVYESNPDKLEATPGNLLVPLIKAVQELSQKVKILENRIHVLENR